MSLAIFGVETMMKYAILSSILFLAACGSAPIEEVKPVEIRTIEVPRPAPIVPSVDQLRLRPVNWIVITPENVDQKFAEIKSGELVLFAVTTEGYENMALNLSDIRAMIDQQTKIIAIYKSHFK
jgi:hypothetical protein